MEGGQNKRIGVESVEKGVKWDRIEIVLVGFNRRMEMK